MSDSKVYIAEKILSERKIRGVKQYLIKWKGYPMSENTWEPVENILCPTLLTTFENKKNGSQRKKLKTNHTPTNGHSSRRSVHRSKSPSPRQQTPASTPTPEPQPKPATPKLLSSPVARTSSSSPRPVARTSEIHTSPRPPSNQSAHASPSSSSSPGPQLLNQDMPKLPQPAIIMSTKLLTDKQATRSSPKLESPLEAESSALGPAKPQPVSRTPPAPVRNTTPQSPMSVNNSAKSSAQIFNSVQVYRPQSAMIDRHANTQVQIIQAKNRKFAVMSTVITDVTVNNHTITISESKTNQGFFREGNRNSVDATTQF